MKLNVDLSELNLAAAKMGGLESYLNALRDNGKTYNEGLVLAQEFVFENGGHVSHESDNEVVVLSLRDEEASCFKPFDDIDKFYFEI